LPLLFARNLTRSFPANEVAGVYREADAVRIELGAGKSARVISLWARNADAAAELVKLLPTRQTVELEHSTPATQQSRIDWRMVALVAAPALAIGIGFSTWRGLLQRTDKLAPTNTAPVSSNALITGGAAVPASPAAMPPNAVGKSAEPKVRILVTQNSDLKYASVAASASSASPPETSEMESRAGSQVVAAQPPTYSYPVIEPDTFLSDLEALRAEYLHYRDVRHPDTFRLLEQKWWRVTEQLYRRGASGSFRGQQQLAISRSWRMLLAAHADALDSGDRSQFQFVADELEFAEKLASRLTPTPY
jgi:hypothetical protein